MLQVVVYDHMHQQQISEFASMLKRIQKCIEEITWGMIVAHARRAGSPHWIVVGNGEIWTACFPVDHTSCDTSQTSYPWTLSTPL